MTPTPGSTSPPTPPSIELAPEPARMDEDDQTRSIPSLRSRAAASALEPVLFVSIAVTVNVAEYFVSGPLVGFGPSNFLIALVVLVALNGWAFAGAQSAHGALNGHYVAGSDGSPASVLTLTARQLIRASVLYGVPILVFDYHLGVGVALAATVGAYIRYAPLNRAPWDHLAGTTVRSGFESSTELYLAPITSVADLRLDQKRVVETNRARRVLLGTGLFSIVASVLIVWMIFVEASEFVLAREFSWSLLSGIGWFPRRGVFDLSTLFVGTAWITGIAMLIAGPVGLGVAIYLSEYASSRMRRYLKPMIETLASIPSVVIGYFAISFVSPSLLKPLLGDIGTFSLLAAGIGVGVLTIPIVASISEDAMRVVPQELREASYGLGARRATTSMRVVFPAALSGISAALIVGISRAIGETMVVFIAAGGSGGAIFETDPREPGQAITAAMASLGAGTDSVAGSGLAFQSLYFLGAVLFVLTLLLNVVSDSVVRRFRQVY